MVSISRGEKIWIFISLVSLLLWTFYWLIPSFEHFFNNLLGLPDPYSNRLWYFLPSHFGFVSRFVAVLLGLAGAFLVFVKTKGFIRVKGYVAAALLLEAGYFLALLPSSWALFLFGSNTLGIAYLLQVFVTVPFLAVLGVKVWNYDGRLVGFWKWAGLAFVGYVAALWFNSVLRWFDMVARDGLAVFFSGVTGIGALNAFVLMSLAVVFAVVGAYFLAKKKQGSALKWLGLSLAMVGLHYVVYVFYSYYVGALNFVWLIEVWTIPLLGLGIAMLKTKRSNNEN